MQPVPHVGSSIHVLRQVLSIQLHVLDRWCSAGIIDKIVHHNLVTDMTSIKLLDPDHDVLRKTTLVKYDHCSLLR